MRRARATPGPSALSPPGGGTTELFPGTINHRNQLSVKAGQVQLIAVGYLPMHLLICDSSSISPSTARGKLDGIAPTSVVDIWGLALQENLELYTLATKGGQRWMQTHSFLWLS